MKITEVVIENILAIGEAKFGLDGLGLVHVAGVNNDETSADSNGSGKSSLGDAISWGLWGSTARGISGDDIINTGAGKGAAVRITIDDDGELWRIERYRKYPKLKNGLYLWQFDAATNEWTDRTKGTTPLTQKAIERLLGCSEEVFNAAVYSGQEMMPDIPRMTDKQLKLLVEQAAGVDVLAGAYDIARERYRERAQKRAETQIALDRASQRHGDAVASVARLTQQSQQWDTNQQAKIANLKQQTTAAVGAFNAGKAALDPAAEQSLAAEITATQTKIASVDGERQREQLLQGDLDQARKALSTLQQRVSAETSGVTYAERDVTAALTALDRVKAGVGQPCGECGEAIKQERLAGAITRAEQKVTEAQGKLANAKVTLDATEKRIIGFTNAVTAAETALSDHRKGMTDVSAESARLVNLQRELQIIEAQKREVEHLRQTAAQIGNQWRAENGAANPFAPTIAQADADVLARASDVDAAKVAAVAAAEEEAYAQAVVDVYAPAGVRAHRLDEATPYLNERTAHYLGSLADGAIDAFWTTLTEKKSGRGELTEKFSVTVEKAGSAPTFNALSGGEKRKVRLACALALQDLVATRAAKNIELWIGDEIDDALDPAGLERLMGVLEEKARERGTVLVISHNDIAAYARKTITVEKDQGRATVTVQ